MAAIVPTKIYEQTGLVNNLLYGTVAPDNERVIVIEATTTASSNTFDVSTLIKCTGIKRRLALTIDEGIVATADTWSGTTITFASHAGSGRYVGVFVIKS